MAEEIFIGREEELQRVESLVHDPTGARHTLFLIGPGGVGKTWLLKEIYRRYQEDPDVVPVRIDYGEVRTRTLASLSLYLFFDQLRGTFPAEELLEFRKRLADVEQRSHWQKSHGASEEEFFKVYSFGIDIANRLAKKKRLLILVDTLEARLSQGISDQVNLLASRLRNTVILVAGRPLKSVEDEALRFKSFYKGWTVHDPLRLDPFSREETGSYFLRVLPEKLAPDLYEKLFFLTAGNPILIAIAGEWLVRHIALPPEIDLPISALHALDQPTLKAYRQRFEFALIDKVRTLRQPIDWAVLYLAYLNRRYDPEILRLVLKIDDPEELESLTTELRKLVFVRKSMLSDNGLLHDEVQRLIRDYAWPIVDPDGKIREDLAKQVVQDYYLPAIERLRAAVKQVIDQALEHAAVAGQAIVPPIPDEEFLKQTMQIECLDYQMRLSTEIGLDYLDDLLDEALKSRSYIFIDALNQAVYSQASALRESSAFQVRVSEMWRGKHNFDQAAALARHALNDAQITAADAAKAWNILGQTTPRPEEKVAYFEMALGKARLSNILGLQATILNNLGLIYRQTGEWRLAEDAFRQALRTMDREKDANQYANTLNNLAYVTMLLGDLDRADTLAEKALRMRKETANRAGLAFSYNTKGRIADARGDYAGALREYRTAVEWFRSIADVESVARVQVDIAQVERRASNFSLARELLEPALRSPRPDLLGAALSQSAKVDMDEAEALSRRGDEKDRERIQGLYTSAADFAQRAFEVGESMGDRHRMAVALFDLALIAWQAERREDGDRIAELENLLAGYEFPVERAHWLELQGSFAMVRGDISAAFGHYWEACRVLAGYSPGRFRRVFERVRARFLDAAAPVQAEIRNVIAPRLADLPSHSPLLAFRSLCLDELEA